MPAKNFFHPTGFKLALAVTLVVAAINLWNLVVPGRQSFLELVDKKIVDFVLSNKAVTPTSDQVVIAAIDTKSVDRFGRWPWGRLVMADLLRELVNYYHVKLLAYDVVFSEPDPNDQTSNRVIQTFTRRLETRIPPDQLSLMAEELTQAFSQDKAFARELRAVNNVVGGYFFFFDEANVHHLTPEEREQGSKRIELSRISVIKGANHLEQLPFYDAKAVEANTATLTSEHNLYGYFNVFPDAEDGTVRRVHLVIRHQGNYYPSLDLQVLHRLEGNYPIQLIANEGGVEAIKVGTKVIQTASDGSVMVNYRGPTFTFPHYSVADILDHKVPMTSLRNKVVYLGATEVGVFDLRTTPVGVDFPGVEVHANLLDNLIQGDYFYISDFTKLLTFVLILGLGLAMGLMLPRLSSLYGALSLVVLLLAYWSANFYCLKQFQAWTSFVYVSLTLILTWLAIMLYQYFGEEKDKRFIKSAFSQYLSPEVINALVHDPQMLKLGGEKREMTCIFSDVQGFSSISERLSPEELVELLNEYLSEMTNILLKHGGTIDKYEGDAIIAFFGAPLVQTDHALRAVRAICEMQSRNAALNKQWAQQGKPPLFTRIGGNTGRMVVGNMGSSLRMDYTIMGDAVNLAARLEGANKAYKNYTLISQHTQEQLTNEVVTRELDRLRVVGKAEPIAVFEVVGLANAVEEAVVNAHRYYAKGLSLYRKQQFDEARKYFAQCSKLKGEDGPSQVMLERCHQYAANPPKKWDGVHQLDSK